MCRRAPISSIQPGAFFRLRREPRDGCLIGCFEISAGQRIRIGQDFPKRPGRDDFPAVRAGVRSQVDDVIGAAHGFLVVLDDDERIAVEGESFQGVEKPGVVARVQADGRLVENVEDAAQIRAELSCEPYALGFAAAQRLCGAVEGEVVQSDLAQKAKSLGDFAEDVCGDFLVASPKFEASNDLGRAFIGGRVRDAGNRLALQENAPRGFVDPCSLADGARARFAVAECLMAAFLRELGFEHRVEFLVRIVRPDFAEAAAMRAPAVG